MTSVKILAEPLPHDRPAVRDLPRCDVDIQRQSSSAYWRARVTGEGKAPDYRCSRPAHYTIDGKNLCTRHAGDAALKILLAKENQT